MAPKVGFDSFGQRINPGFTQDYSGVNYANTPVGSPQTSSVFQDLGLTDANPGMTTFDSGKFTTQEFGLDSSLTPAQYKAAGNSFADATASGYGGDQATWDSIETTGVTQPQGITGMDMANIGLGGAQLGLGYLGYLQGRKGMESTIANNRANLEMAQDQLYSSDAMREAGTTKKDEVADSLGSAFGGK